MGPRPVCALKAAQLPISGLVDRSLCSEFQVLCSVVDTTRSAAVKIGLSLRAVKGRVRLFVSTAPCVSCLGALRQFQLYMPHVGLEVANGEELYLLDKPVLEAST